MMTYEDTTSPVMAAKHMHGCCADKACSEKTCMVLPEGRTCGDCVNSRHCIAFYAHTPTDTYCDFFPRRFRECATLAKASTVAAKGERV